MTSPAYDLALAYVLAKWPMNAQREVPIHVPDATRRNLYLLFDNLGYSRGVEIGVNKGSNALRIIRAVPDCKLYCIDPWETYDGMNDFTDENERKRTFTATSKILGDFDNIEIIKKTSMDAIEQFKDYSLDFVYIDGNHEWPYVSGDLFFWSQKVRSGGIVSGHDYVSNPRHFKFNDVTEIVDAYTRAFDISPWWVVDKAIFPEHPGTFFWVKP